MAEAHPLIGRLEAVLRAGAEGPVSRVVVEDVWLAVVEGSLATGERLPTARELAVGLGVSPRAVERAYEELEARGVVATRPGEGTFISLQPPSEAERARHHRFAELCREAYERARELGFTVNDLIDALSEYRSMERSTNKEAR